MFYEVIPTQGTNVLTYSSPAALKIGQVVLVPIRQKLVPALVYKKVVQPNFPTKPISKILYTTPLPAHLLTALKFLSTYYLTPLPAALSLILPTGIEKTRRKTEQTAPETPKPLQTPEIPLNTAQKNALEVLQNAQEATSLLHGVTGSGKTNIYLKMTENALKSQKSVILLVPEIALTSQLVRVFESYFGPRTTLIHSKQTESERHKIWENLLNTQDPSVIIGPRSALFAPVHNLGLIIIDECHEQSFTQENSPKYSALRLASALAKTHHFPCILGSATPLLQDFYLAKSKNSLVPLTQKAKSTALAPDVKIIDLKDRQNFSKNRYFSNPLLDSLKQNLKDHRQTLIFHNRRGSSPLSLCESCGTELLCPHCFLPLTLHSDTFNLVCHTCGHTEKIPTLCPSCGSPNILHKGFGTKLLESELNKLFKTARIARFDADNKKSDSLDALYDDVKRGNIDIIIGTQTVAKGLDLPNLATVGIVQADAGLSLPDFSAEEKTFELITQVIGRVGRGHLDKAEVIIQTFQPGHPTLNFAIKNDYANFAAYLLKKRKTQHFPPFYYLAKLEITLKTEKTVVQKIQNLYSLLSKNLALEVSAPLPNFHEHTDRGYTWQLLVRSKSRNALLTALSALPPEKSLHLTLDPPSLL